MGSRAVSCEKGVVNRPQQSCPCCGHLTLSERGGFEICPVCFWEDDGQDDIDAHVDRGGPNRGRLWHARANYLKFAACEERAKEHVRPPTRNEPKTRQWSLLDDTAVELLPSADVTPWNLLHDGSLVGLRRDGTRVSASVEIPYLRTRFEEPGAVFVLELLDCSEVEYAPYEGVPTACLEQIAGAEPEVLEAAMVEGRVVIWCSGGVLRIRYAHFALRFDSRTPLALVALDDCARRYWDEWDQRRPGRQSPKGGDA